jgi:hypothetical protein
VNAPPFSDGTKSRQIDQAVSFIMSPVPKFQLGDGGYGAAMENAERTAIDMIRRYGTREAAIQQAHAYDVEAITDDERAFWRAVLAELRSSGVTKAAE